MEQKQSEWRWCNKCQGLFYGANKTSGYCPNGGGHDYEGSGNYSISYLNKDGQNSWRWCNKCQGLFYAGNSNGWCSAGGQHNSSQSYDYILSTNGVHQKNWRWCNKCEGLFFAGNNSNGVCPRGNGHDLKGSMDYCLN